MKCSRVLKPLSREHHAALGLARSAVAASRGVSLLRELAVALPDLFARELNPRFRIEEQLRPPPLHDAIEHARAARILEQHRQRRALVHATGRGDRASLESLGLPLEARTLSVKPAGISAQDAKCVLLDPAVALAAQTAHPLDRQAVPSHSRPVRNRRSVIEELIEPRRCHGCLKFDVSAGG